MQTDVQIIFVLIYLVYRFGIASFVNFNERKLRLLRAAVALNERKS